MTFGLLAPKDLNHLSFHVFISNVPDEGYSGNLSYVLHQISTFLSKENILNYQIEKIVSKQHSPETQNQTSGTENLI